LLNQTVLTQFSVIKIYVLPKQGFQVVQYFFLFSAITMTARTRRLSRVRLCVLFSANVLAILDLCLTVGGFGHATTGIRCRVSRNLPQVTANLHCFFFILVSRKKARENHDVIFQVMVHLKTALSNRKLLQRNVNFVFYASAKICWLYI
jgi:hypothetical protein